MIREEAERIRDVVCREAGVTVEELLSPLRFRDLVVARQVLCYMLTRRGLSLSQAGRWVGRDHATVLWSLRRVADAMVAPQSYRDLNRLLDACRRALDAISVTAATFSQAGRENVPPDGESAGNRAACENNDIRP